ncbi:MAG: AAA family ATPase [Polyangiaceae bacterium]|nr:AAA family ATPase [Polyangiaceae bacterium]
MKLPLRGVAVYNPALLSKDELLAQFVARKTTLETILSELRSEARPNHWVLIGPRGMGKTTLLRRIYFAVDEEPTLSKQWIALPFPEEQYNLARLSDFYLNCIDALADALTHSGRVAEAQALDKARDALSGPPGASEDEQAAAARDLLLSWADKLHRKLLLLVDNVEMVLDRLHSSQWKLRELLGHDNRLCLIGASASAPESTFEYKQAFYEFFRFCELRPLDETEARELLLHLARVRGAKEIERILTDEPARIRTLFTLSGGNPRTLVQLYAVFSQSSDGDARSDLERLLDECTPIYKARFEALSVQGQQIVDAVALHWHPVMAGEVAAITRLDVNVVTSQLSRLLKEGVLEAVEAAEGTRKAYQIAERFFNIWYLMRAGRRQRQRLVWLVEFLRLFYNHELLAHARTTLGRAATREPGTLLRDGEYRMALAQVVEDRALRRALVSSAVQPWAELEGHGEKLGELLELAPTEIAAKPIADRHTAMANLHKKVLQAHVKKKGWDAEAFWELLGGSLVPLESKVSMVEHLPNVPSKTVDAWISQLRLETQKARKTVRSDVAVNALQRALREGYLDGLTDVEGAEAAALSFGCPELRTLVVANALLLIKNPTPADLQPLEKALQAGSTLAYGWFACAVVRERVKQVDGAEEAYRKCLELDPDDAVAWRKFGVLLFVDREPPNLEGAETALRKALSLDKTDPNSWYWLGKILSERGHATKGAEKAYQQAIKLDGSDPSYWCALGELLSSDQPEAAEKALRKATNLAPNEGAMWDSLADFLQGQKRYGEAEDAYRRATSAETPYEWAWLSLGRMLDEHLQKLDEAEQAYRRALAFDPSRPHALFWLTTLRHERGLIDAETETLARELVRVKPDRGNKLLLASVLVRRGFWDEPVQLAEATLHTATPEEIDKVWGMVVRFFSDIVHSKGAPVALTLLEKVGLSERWLPLQAALMGLRDGPRALAAFAPEVRRPAEALLLYLQPKAPSPTASASPQPPAKAPPRARRPAAPRRKTSQAR